MSEIGAKKELPRWLLIVEKFVIISGGIVGLGLAGWGLIVFFTGGMLPQTKVSTDRLSDVTAAIQGSVATLQSTVTKLSDKVDQMPRTADFNAHEARFQRDENELGELQHKTDQAAVDVADVKARVTRLENGTGAPARLPR